MKRGDSGPIVRRGAVEEICRRDRRVLVLRVHVEDDIRGRNGASGGIVRIKERLLQLTLTMRWEMKTLSY